MHRPRHPSLVRILALAVIAAAAGSLTAPAVRAGDVVGFSVTWEPRVARVGDKVTFTAWRCQFPQGEQMFGADGVPGPGDGCKKAESRWRQLGQKLGSLSATRGKSVVLRVERAGRGRVEAEHDGMTSSVELLVAEATDPGPDPGTDPDPGPGPAVGRTIVVFPFFLQLVVGESRWISVWECPANADGRPLLGPDGVPGTGEPAGEPVPELVRDQTPAPPPDDDCTPAVAEFTVESQNPASPAIELTVEAPLVAALVAGTSQSSGSTARVTGLRTGEAGILVAVGSGRDRMVSGGSVQVIDGRLRILTGGILGGLVDTDRVDLLALPSADAMEFVGLASTLVELDPESVTPDDVAEFVSWIRADELRYLDVVLRLDPSGPPISSVPVEIVSYDPTWQVVVDRAEVALDLRQGNRFLFNGWLVIVAPATRFPEGLAGRNLPGEVGPYLFLTGELGGNICLRRIENAGRIACTTSEDDPVAPDVAIVSDADADDDDD